MGLLDKIFPGKKEPEQAQAEYFQTLSAYTPAFTTFEGGLYEMELTRACVHSFATHCSKLKPVVVNDKNFNRKMQVAPNPYMDTVKYLYRLATILMVQNTAFIVPLYGQDMQTVTGFFPVLPQAVEIREHKGRLYLVYQFSKGKAAIEFERAGYLTQFYFKDDFFGENNRAMDATLDLLHAQNEGIVEGIKSSAAIRFLARLSTPLKPKDIEEERKRFIETNLKPGSGNVLLYDTKYADVKAIDSKPFVVDDKQVAQIKENVFTYFGTNDKILQNKFTSSEWNAYYEGKIEPFALQAALVHTRMKYTEREQAFGNEILFTSNRMQYLSSEEKLNTVTQLFDRGMMNQDDGREVFNMEPLNTETSKKYFIRLEYAGVDALNEGVRYRPAEEPTEENNET